MSEFLALVALTLTALAILASASPAAAQERAQEVTVELRVIALEADSLARVDRGEADGLEDGDLVQFHPRSGGSYRGRVIEVRERSALVEVFDADFRPEPGTRAEVSVPAARLAHLEEQEPEQEPEQGADSESGPVIGPADVLALEISVKSSGSSGTVVIDHGATDGIEVGDAVLLHAKDDRTYRGAIVRLGNNTAVARLEDQSYRPSAGTPGEVLVPLLRPEDAAGPEPAVGLGGAAALGGDAPAQDEFQGPPGLEYDWENRDEEWSGDMPLLAEVNAVAPKDRAMQLTGLFYLWGIQRWTSEESRRDFFYRAGSYLRFENPFGNGGGILFDGEVNYRSAQVPSGEGENEGRLRLDRLSYYSGGTRFSPSRWEAGRFLQTGMPEFGVLDGFEYGHRQKNGSRWGASVGFVPQPPEFNTGTDFQVAAFYEWVADPREQFSLAGGFQKTLHDWSSDRDLFVVRMRYLPLSGWTVSATTWVDLYTSGDEAKGSGPELTQAWVTAGKNWNSGDAVQFTFRHLRYPELLAYGFDPVTFADLANNRYDRLAVSGWKAIGRKHRFFGQVGAWGDQDDTGGDGEVGFEIGDVFRRASRLNLSAFGTRGAFSTVAGGRASYAWFTGRTRWEFLYELSNANQHGFTSDIDDILQHRLRGSADFTFATTWRLTLYGQGQLWDNESALTVGFSLQKSF